MNNTENRFNAAFDNVVNEAEVIPRKVMLELDAQVVPPTPVLEGRAKAGWIPSNGSPSSKTTEATDPSGESTISTAQATHLKSAPFETMHLTNNLPYIEALEDGHSDKTEEGFIKLAVQRVANIFK